MNSKQFHETCISIENIISWAENSENINMTKGQLLAKLSSIETYKKQLDKYVTFLEQEYKYPYLILHAQQLQLMLENSYEFFIKKIQLKEYSLDDEQLTLTQQNGEIELKKPRNPNLRRLMDVKERKTNRNKIYEEDYAGKILKSENGEFLSLNDNNKKIENNNVNGNSLAKMKEKPQNHLPLPRPKLILNGVKDASKNSFFDNWFKQLISGGLQNGIELNLKEELLKIVNDFRTKYREPDNRLFSEWLQKRIREGLYDFPDLYFFKLKISSCERPEYRAKLETKMNEGKEKALFRFGILLQMAIFSYLSKLVKAQFILNLTDFLVGRRGQEEEYYFDGCLDLLLMVGSQLGQDFDLNQNDSMLVQSYQQLYETLSAARTKLTIYTPDHEKLNKVVHLMKNEWSRIMMMAN